MSFFLLFVVLVLIGTNAYTLVKFNKVRSDLEKSGSEISTELVSCQKELETQRSNCICKDL